MTPAQDEFASRFNAYLASAKAYKPLSDFIEAQSEGDLRDCATTYFRIAGDYDVRDERSLKTFYGLSARLLAIADVYFALRFGVLVDQKNTLWGKHYTALDGALQSRLTVLVRRRKAQLSLAQREFLQIFEVYVKATHPDPKKLEKFLDYYKFAQLHDSLLVYFEVSQKYADTDKNSLTVFYALSFKIFSKKDCDSDFAARYEKNSKADGTIWKRRFDALEWWQREKLEKAYKEKQTFQRTIEYTDKDKKKHQVTERLTIPNTAPSPRADPEDQRPTAPTSATQREFLRRFRAYMDARNKQTTQNFTEYLQARSAQELQECLAIYLQASKRDGDLDEYSLSIFFGIAALAVARSDGLFAFKLKSDIQSAGTPAARCYDALNARQKGELTKEITKKEKHHRFIDDMKIAYYQKNHKDPDLESLRNYVVPLSDDQAGLLSTLLGRCDVTFTTHRIDEFMAAFDALSKAVHDQKDLMVLYGMLQYSRGSAGLSATVRYQLSWYLAGALFVQALPQRPEIYQRGLSDEELSLLFDATDRRNPYFNDFALRMDYLWLRRQSHAQFTQVSKAFAGLLLMAERFDMRLVPLEEAAAVQGLVELLKKHNPDYLYGIRIPVMSRDQGKTIKIGQTLGKVYVVWWDPNTGGDTYVEVEGYNGQLFGAESYRRLGQIYEDDAIWGEIARSTAGMLELINLYIQFLGYLPDLVTGGLSGLVKAVVINYAIEKTAEALGLNATAFQLVLLGAGLMTHLAGAGAKGNALTHATEDTLTEGRSLKGTLETPDADRGLEDLLAGSEHGTVGGPPSGETPTDMRGILTPDRDIRIRGEEEIATDLPRGTADRATADPLVGSDGVADRGTASPSTLDPPPRPATRNDLELAQAEMKKAQDRCDNALKELDQKKNNTGDILDRLEDPDLGKKDLADLNRKLEGAQRVEGFARKNYKQSKYELRAAASRVQRLRADLAGRGELEPSLGSEWNLPNRPVKFRRGTVEVDSWSDRGFVGTRDERRDWERLLQEDPDGELSKRLLDPASDPNPSKRKLYPARGGDMPSLRQNPQIIELAHVLSKREKGREVFIIMTKARNQQFGRTLERTGGVFKDDAIIIQGLAIERQSAIDLGIPRSVVDRAPVIEFVK